MTTTPAPLTPPDCDLRAFRTMPFDVQRFRDSDLVTEEEPEAIVAAILLWGAAWQQVPAASLPNDDRALAKFAGYGRSIAAWHQVKHGALRGFIECSDGRLYHEVVAEKANEAWDKRLAYDWGKAKDRHRKAMAKLPEDERSEFVEFDDWKAGRVPVERPHRQARLPLESQKPSAGTVEGEAPVRPPAHARHARDTGAKSVPTALSAGTDPTFRRNDRPIPPETALKGKEGNGMEQESSHPNPSDSNPPCADAREGLPYEDVHELWLTVCEAAGYKPVNPTQIGKSMDQVREWRDEGIDFEKVLLPTIRSIVADTKEPTRTLGRFRAAVAHEHARLAARNEQGRGYKPPPSPVLEPKGEDERFRPMRVALLERVGAAAYSLAFNDVRFRAEPVEFGEERVPLHVDGSPIASAAVVEGTYAGVVKAAAKKLGFTDVWKGR
jgi:hypothetical protein